MQESYLQEAPYIVGIAWLTECEQELSLKSSWVLILKNHVLYLFILLYTGAYFNLKCYIFFQGENCLSGKVCHFIWWLSFPPGIPSPPQATLSHAYPRRWRGTIWQRQLCIYEFQTGSATISSQVIWSKGRSRFQALIFSCERQE